MIFVQLLKLILMFSWQFLGFNTCNIEHISTLTVSIRGVRWLLIQDCPNTVRNYK